MSLAERHHQPLFADRGTRDPQCIAPLPHAVLHTSARAALAIIVLKIVPGSRPPNSMLSPNGLQPLLHVLTASFAIVNALNVFDFAFLLYLRRLEGGGMF